jgi:hypothetical protein
MGPKVQGQQTFCDTYHKPSLDAAAFSTRAMNNVASAVSTGMAPSMTTEMSSDTGLVMMTDASQVMAQPTAAVSKVALPDFSYLSDARQMAINGLAFVIFGCFMLLL